MLRRFSVNFAIFSMVVDASLTFLALFLAVAIRPFLPQFPYLVPVEQLTLSQTLYIIVPSVWVLTFLLSSVYDPKRIYKITDEVQTIVIAEAVAAMICAGILYLGFREFSRWLFASFVFINTVFILGWRVLLRMSFRLWHQPSRERRVLIVGAGKTGRSVGNLMQEYHWAGLNLVGYLDDNLQKKNSLLILGSVADVRAVVEKHHIEDVVVALPQRAYGQVNQLTMTLHDLPVHVRVVPDYFSLALYRASVDDFGGIPMINLRDPALNEVQRLVKRLFDLIVGGVMTLTISPILVIIGLLVKLDSNGPIIFRQERIGENGRIFKMFKFRTMVPDADSHREEITEINPENGQILFKKRPDDPRITRLGRFLRRTSLDELPQLLNVLLGDMSLVGPRPELPWMVDQYEPWQRKRFAVPQGMTGWWQVNGRSDKPLHLHTEDDLYYVQNYSIWMDIYILLKTPWVVLRGKGAY